MVYHVLYILRRLKQTKTKEDKVNLINEIIELTKVQIIGDKLNADMRSDLGRDFNLKKVNVKDGSVTIGAKFAKKSPRVSALVRGQAPDSHEPCLIHFNGQSIIADTVASLMNHPDLLAELAKYNMTIAPITVK